MIIFLLTLIKLRIEPINAVIPATAVRVEGLIALIASSKDPIDLSDLFVSSVASLTFFVKSFRSPVALTTPRESISRTSLLISALNLSPC